MLCDAVGVAARWRRVFVAQTNSALLPMFFYFVFFLEAAATVLWPCNRGARRGGHGCGRLKASEKYFGKMVDSKKNRD